MSGKIPFIQANMRKSHKTTHSFFHDPDFEQASLLLLTELYSILNTEGHPSSVPTYQPLWLPYYPRCLSRTLPRSRKKAPFRAMIWAAKQHQIHQIPIDHSDIAALVLTLLTRKILIISIYIPCSTSRSQDEPKLKLRLELVKSTYSELQKLMPNLELAIRGDFNQWDILWGGDNFASHLRQGEGRSIIEVITELDLQLFLPRGTITYTGYSCRGESTIDLTMVLSHLFSERVVCQTHETERGFDHLAIVSEFVTETPEVILPARKGFENAKWNVLNTVVKELLFQMKKMDLITNLEEYTTQLIKIVLVGIEKAVPLAKPSSYNKTWWTEDLTQLRMRYTLLRNQGKRQHRNYGSEFARPHIMLHK